MITKKQCTGCGVCAAVCGEGAIVLSPDEEGFFYPKVDAVKCVGCGHCECVCPIRVDAEAREPLKVYAAMACDDGLRRESSSGALFTLLAENVIKAGGVVYGAAVTDADLTVRHIRVESQEGLAALRGSKYVQSDVGLMYVDAKQQLEMGRRILFSGTPCQIAALRSFLNRDYENLLCVEVICHGVPSPMVFHEYLRNRIRKGVGLRVEKDFGRFITKVSFRCKRNGWKNNSILLAFQGKEYCKTKWRDSYLRGFAAELFSRTSCHECKFRGLRSGADVTLGDFWQVEKLYADFGDDDGVSLVLVNSRKGERAFESIRSACCLHMSDFSHACLANPALLKSPWKNPKRKIFFEKLSCGEDFDRIIRDLLDPTLFARIRHWMSAILYEYRVRG